jgi:hypothetical protein
MVAPNENGGDGGDELARLNWEGGWNILGQARVDARRFTFNLMEQARPIVDEIRTISDLFIADCECSQIAACSISAWDELIVIFPDNERSFNALAKMMDIACFLGELAICPNKCIIEHATGNCTWNRAPSTE